MPIYEYRCERGHTFEVTQRMSDDPLTTCTVCKAPVQRVFHPVAVHFKGSGFYNTDYGKKSKGAASGSSDGGKSESGSADSKSTSDSKPAADAKASDSKGSSTSSSKSES
ncbi:MAG TPA: FmdB family zinc ribbon protein [Thermoleophilaceae bacterium]